MMEPFLMNPHLGIINPRSRKKKGKKSMAKRNSRAHMAYVRSFKKNATRTRTRKRNPPRRRRRANPWPAAGLVLNPRKRRVARRRNARVANPRRRRGYRRNPSVMGIELPPLNKILFAGVGFIAPPMVEGMIAGLLPASMQTGTISKYAVRIASVLALAFGIRKFIGKNESDMALIGGGVYVLSTAAVEFLPDMFGTAPVIPAGVSAYVGSARQLSQYVPANQRIMNGLGMPSAAWSNAQSSGAIGGTGGRFKRF